MNDKKQASQSGPTPPTGSYVIWVKHKSLVESPRYVHFSHRPRGAFKVRDYISQKLHHQIGAQVHESAFTIKVCALSCQEVWDSAQKRIPASRDNGLFVNVDRFDWWKDTLTKMTNEKGL